MSFEQTKAVKRRYNIGAFHNTYFVGNGIDIGCGNDSLSGYGHAFRLMTSVRGWDTPDGDAQYLSSIEDNTYDFVTSSHSLEHMEDPRVALTNWIRVCKPKGHLIITIPDEEMYEYDQWPSKFNTDHKWSFTLRAPSRTPMPKSINVLELCSSVNHLARVEKIEVIRDLFYDPEIYTDIKNKDQTHHPAIECCIEFVLRKE